MIDPLECLYCPECGEKNPADSVTVLTVDDYDIECAHCGKKTMVRTADTRLDF